MEGNVYVMCSQQSSFRMYNIMIRHWVQAIFVWFLKTHFINFEKFRSYYTNFMNAYPFHTV